MRNLVYTRRLSPLSGAHVTQSCRIRNSWNTSAVVLITGAIWNNDGWYVLYARSTADANKQPGECARTASGNATSYLNHFVAIDFPLKFFSPVDDSDWAHRNLFPCYREQPMGVPQCRTSGSINRPVKINHICRIVNHLSFTFAAGIFLHCSSFVAELCKTSGTFVHILSNCMRRKCDDDWKSAEPKWIYYIKVQWHSA